MMSCRVWVIHQWRQASDLELNVIGGDVFRFHAILFLAWLVFHGSELKWKLPPKWSARSTLALALVTTAGGALWVNPVRGTETDIQLNGLEREVVVMHLSNTEAPAFVVGGNHDNYPDIEGTEAPAIQALGSTAGRCSNDVALLAALNRRFGSRARRLAGRPSSW